MSLSVQKQRHHLGLTNGLVQNTGFGSSAPRRADISTAAAAAAVSESARRHEAFTVAHTSSFPQTTALVAFTYQTEEFLYGRRASASYQTHR